MLPRFPKLATTGIGSLPFTTVPEALAHARAPRVDLVYLPQLASESMLTLESAAWAPWLEQVSVERPAFVKLQLAGPDTLARFGGQGNAVGRVEARALAQIRALRALGSTPLVFLDEPALEEMAPHPDLVRRLQQEGAVVGLHACGEVDFGRVLAELGLDLLSFDVGLSLGAVLGDARGVRAHLERGGRFSLGMVPTDGSSLDVEAVKDAVRSRLGATHATVFLEECLLTPCCGLARRTVPETETVFAQLRQVATAFRA